MPDTDPRSWYRTQRRTIGTITPSGNIVVERMTTAILADFPAVSGHFSRVAVVGSTDAYKDDYDWDGMMRAAELLSHAAPDVICWNGSKGGSIGLDADRRLCERITEATGKPATTSSLAILEVFAATGVRRFGLVTPFASGYAGRIPPHFRIEGYACVSEAHAGLNDNLSYCAVPDADIVAMVRQVATWTARCHHHILHQFPGRASGGRTGSRHRHPDLRFGRSLRVEVSAADRRTHIDRRPVGQPVYRSPVRMTTLIRSARVLTLDATDTEYARADILIEDGTIIAVGPDLAAPDADVIDAVGLIAMPGLINGHFHSQVSLMAGSVPSLPLELFMLYEVPPLGDRPPDPRLIYLQTMLGAVEMLRHGITAVHDDAFHNPWPTRPAIDAVMSAYRDSGLRATVAINHQNRPELDKLAVPVGTPSA